MASAEVPIVFDFDFNFNEDFDISSVMPEPDAIDEDDDESDNDQSDTDGTSKADSSIKKRPTIREHSKAQREKRKNMLETLERDAAVVTKQKEEKDAQYQIVFDAIENARKIYLRNVALFLQSWFGSSTVDEKHILENRPDGDSGKYDPLDECRSSWACVVDVENAAITMPLTMAFWVPPSTSSSPPFSPTSPTSKTPRHQRLNLKTFGQMKGYKAGYSLLCSSIAKYGTNVVDSLLFSASIKTDTCAVDGRMFASGFSVVSKNALLCGGSNEIAFDGFVYCKFNEANRLVLVEIYFNGIEFHQLMFSTFGPSIYRPMTLRDKMIVGEPSSFINVCQIVTTLTGRKQREGEGPVAEDEGSSGLPFTVLSANSTAESVFGSICGQQLISSREELGDNLWSTAMDWMPQFEHLDALKQLFPDRFLQWSLCSSKNTVASGDDRYTDSDDKDDAKNAFVQILPYRYDPPGTILPPACAKSQPKPLKRCSFSQSRDEEDLDDHNKNAVQAILKKSRNHIISALLKAKSPDMSDDSAGDRDRKGSGAKSEGKESKRGSIMSIQSNSTDISRVCSKEAYEDWLVSDELLDILSDPNTCSPLHSRRPSNESQGTWNLFIANNVKNEPNAFSSDSALHPGTGKKAKIEKSSVKQSKKVNFEDTEKEGSQIIEGGRVTPSLVKGPLSPALFGPSVSDEEGESIPAGLPPNRALWIIHRCRPVRSESVAEVLLEDFLNRILLVYGGRIPHWSTLDEGHSHSSHAHSHSHSSSSNLAPLVQEMCVDGAHPTSHFQVHERPGKLPSQRWRFSSTGEIIGLLARAKRLLASIRAARATGCRDVKASLKRFVRWVMAVDHASSSLLLELEDEYGEALVVTADGNDRAADRGRGQSAAKRGVEYVSTSINDSHEEDEESSSRRRKIRHGAEFEVLTPTGLTPVAEKQLLKSISQELSVFFTQVRTSGVVKRLTLMLRPNGDSSSTYSPRTGSVPIVLTEEESKPAEQFIFLCWTRHSHTLVQELMESTKQYVAEKQYTEALAALSEVIKIDPFFAEAYNRRATVHFGLKCADDCFADIERVLRIESMHYGALSGKGLMLMKLGRYTPAIEAFERAIAINPVLGRGALRRHLQQCLDANASIHRRMHSQAVLNASYVATETQP